MTYFFYGTLCDPDVLALVLGYRPSPRQLQPAVLPGFRRKQARNRTYPVLVPAPGGRVDGLLFSPGRPADRQRLAAYEGPEYILRRLPVLAAAGRTAPEQDRPAAPCRAGVFVAARSAAGESALPPARADWHPGRWRRRDKPQFLQSLKDPGPSHE